MRFVTCRLPDGVEDPAILSQNGTQVWPLSWLGLSYETLSDAIPFLTPQVRFGLQLAISGIPALPVEAVTLQSPIPCPAQDVVCLGINYMAHSDEAEKYSADAFSTQHQDAIYFSKRVSRAVPDGVQTAHCLWAVCTVSFRSAASSRRTPTLCRSWTTSVSWLWCWARTPRMCPPGRPKTMCSATPS
mgnify:CR=1 FL=1